MSVIPGERFALRGDLLDFSADPALDDPSSPAVRWRPAHWVLVEDGRIAAVQPDDPPEGWPRWCENWHSRPACSAPLRPKRSPKVPAVNSSPAKTNA